MKDEHPRHLRLLSQYASERIDNLLSHETPPREIYDMTTWRLDRPEYLLEVVDGVLADPGFREKWGTWRPFRKELLEVAQPAWDRGMEAYHRFIEDGQSQGDPSDTGMKVAIASEKDQNMQMWFYEGWLAAMEEEESGE